MVFLELRRHCVFSHEVRWGTQGASCVVLGKSVFLLVARGARPCSGVMVGEVKNDEGIMRHKPWVSVLADSIPIYNPGTGLALSFVAPRIRVGHTEMLLPYGHSV